MTEQDWCFLGVFSFAIGLLVWNILLKEEISLHKISASMSDRCVEICKKAHSGSLAEHWSKNKSQTPPALQPGDIVEMTVTGLGTIRNRVVAPKGADVSLGAVKRVELDH
mgnify:CR=1 FL=1